MIRRAAAPEGDPVVAGALSVDDEVPIVGEGLVVGETNLVPKVGRERFGGDHQGVQRHDGATFVWQVRRESLGGSHHEVGVHVGSDRHDLGSAVVAAWDDPRHRGVLEDHRAQSLIDVAQSPNQSRGVDPGAVRRVHRSERARHPAVLVEIAFVDPGEVRLADAHLARRRDLLGEPRDLDIAAGELHRAAPLEVRVDAVGSRRRAEFDDGRLEYATLMVEGLLAVTPDDAGVRHGKESRGPPAVAPRRAEAADLFLEDRDTQVAVSAQELTRGPQTGEPATDDRHVDVQVVLERRTGRDRWIQ